jgi:hypothetical protein
MRHRGRCAAWATACIALALAWLGAAPAPSADAGRVVTWKTQSRHVDPGRVEFGRPPLCGKCAPHPRDGLYVNVWLPDGYDGTRRFPVLYLLHGGDGQYDFWLESPRENDPRGTIVPDLIGDFLGRDVVHIEKVGLITRWAARRAALQRPPEDPPGARSSVAEARNRRAPPPEPRPESAPHRSPGQTRSPAPSPRRRSAGR